MSSWGDWGSGSSGSGSSGSGGSWGDWGSSKKKKKTNDWGDWGSSASGSDKKKSSSSWDSWGTKKPETVKFEFGKERSDRSDGNPMRDLQSLMKQYSPNRADCRFEVILYSKVPPAAIRKFEKHPLTRPALWELGVRNNPDPKRLVPVAIRGFSQLKNRANLCAAGYFSCHSALTEMSQQLDEVRSHVERRTRSEVMDARQMQLELTRRLLAVVTCYLERHSAHGGDGAMTRYYSSATASSRLTADELRLKQGLSTVLSGAKEVSREMATLDESLYTLSTESEAYQRRVRRSEAFGMWTDENTEPNLSGEGLSKLMAFLKGQQTMISNMSRLVEDDVTDLQIMQKGLRMEQGP